MSTKVKTWTHNDYNGLKEYLQKNMTYEEIARAMGRSPGAIEQAVIRIIMDLYNKEKVSADEISRHLHISRRYVNDLIDRRTVTNEDLYARMTILEKKMDLLLRTLGRLTV